MVEDRSVVMGSSDGAARDPHAELPDEEITARFEQIVAHWGPEDGAEVLDPPMGGADPSHVDGPSAGPDAVPAPPSPSDPFLGSIPVWRGPTGPAADATGSAVADEEDDEGFVPPEVQLPPGEDIHYWGALTGLVLGPLLVLYVVFAQPFYGTWWLLAGIALIVGGFGLLVLRAPKERDPFDSDDGSRV